MTHFVLQFADIVYALTDIKHNSLLVVTVTRYRHLKYSTQLLEPVYIMYSAVLFTRATLC